MPASTPVRLCQHAAARRRLERVKVGRAKEFAEKRIVVTLVQDTRRAIDAVRGRQSMTEFCREAIAREIQRRLTAKPKGKK